MRQSTDDLELPPTGWSIELDESMTESLHSLLFLEEVNEVDGIQFLVDRFKGLQVSIHADEHPPPHFCVMNGSENANYRISDCEQLNGGFTKEYRIIRKWHQKNKDLLIRVWNERRPSDCPVGEYRED